jgi:hypothetical protein
MTPIDTPAWAADFEVFQARFAGSFARRDPREQVVKSRPGLLSSVKRKNGWQIAAAVGDSDPPPPSACCIALPGTLTRCGTSCNTPWSSSLAMPTASVCWMRQDF